MRDELIPLASNDLFGGAFHRRDETFSAASVEEITG
jgi:hypothetical protein